MPKAAHARRYARAVFELALEKMELDRWQADFQKISLAAGEASFQAFLESPKIKFEDKTALLDRVLDGISPLAMNLMKLLISRKRVGMIKEIAGEFSRLVDISRGVQRADIVTAVPLDNETRKNLSDTLGKLAGAKIELKERVEPAILGGVIARLDGKLLDGSARTRLEALKRELAG